MAKAELKTKKTKASAEDFLNTIKDEQRRKDCFTVLALMEKATGAKAKMWGGSVVGFGNTLLKYESGRELDWFVCGFSPRKANLTLYGLGTILNNSDLSKKLGKHKTGKGCLYINSLAEVDKKVLNELIKLSVKAKT
jgi:hypothetical protein